MEFSKLYLLVDKRSTNGSFGLTYTESKILSNMSAINDFQEMTGSSLIDFDTLIWQIVRLGWHLLIWVNKTGQRQMIFIDLLGNETFLNSTIDMLSIGFLRDELLRDFKHKKSELTMFNDFLSFSDEPSHPKDL